jgi:hypothetical protein
MGPMKLATRIFIDVFQITEPDAAHERVARWYISSLLALIAVGVVCVLTGVYLYGHR